MTIMTTRNNTSNTRTTRPSRRGGFTLVELLLVLTILAILAGIVLPKFSNVGANARKTAVQADIATFKTALNMFEIDMGYYPKGRDGLNNLVVKPSGLGNNTKWHKYLDVDKLPVDENQPVAPPDANGVSKFAGEQYWMLENRVRNRPVVSLRLTNCYGPRLRRPQ